MDIRAFSTSRLMVLNIMSAAIRKKISGKSRIIISMESICSKRLYTCELSSSARIFSALLPSAAFTERLNAASSVSGADLTQIWLYRCFPNTSESAFSSI